MEQVSLEAQKIFVPHGYRFQKYGASIVGRKDGAERKSSEIKIHFVQESISNMLIDHAIIQRGARSQKVRTARKATTTKAYIKDLEALVKLPVCFTSLD